MKKISSLLFNKVMGWRVVNELPRLSKCVIAVAPHTSNWDFLVGKLAYSSLGRTANFLIKAEWFFFPFNLFFKSIGGIPVNRHSRSSLTDSLAEEFHAREHMELAITPEGTRKPVKEWKGGFYYIAQKANVPIVLIGLDYAKKEAIFLGVFHPSGDYESDIVKIKSYYKGIRGKKPENFLL